MKSSITTILVGSLMMGGEVLADRWDWQNTGPQVRYGILAMAIDPTTPDILYAGSDEGWLFKSIDAGLSWGHLWGPGLQIKSGGAVRSIAIDPDDPQVVYVVGDHLRRSGDGGITWETVDIRPATRADQVLVSRDGNTLYLVGEQALYRSIDQGSQWLELGLSGRITALVEGSTKDLWAGIWNGYPGPSPSGEVTAVFRSSDGGLTWQDQLLPSTTGVISDIAVDPNRPEVVYVGIRLTEGSGSGVLFKTSDGGHSWQKVFELEGGNVRTIAIDPHDSQRVFLGSELKVHAAGVFWSRDGGQTWAKIHNGGPTKILLNPIDSRVMYAAMREVAPGGVYLFTSSEDKTAVQQQSWGLLKRANSRR